MSKALALKWRPKSFRDLIGQEAVSQTLSLSLQTGKLSHAYLFSGLRGSGKTSTARIFAKALVCEKAPTSQPCEVCAGCIAANESRHIDIIEMDAASNRGIDDVRSLIESTKYRPSVAPFKVYILDEAHMLSLPAFNALLKTLEEPPEYVKFIFATTDPLKLPATILSRTLHFRFSKIPKKAVVAHLEHILASEKVEYEKAALDVLARSAEGSLRDTLTLLDQAIAYGKGAVDLQGVIAMLGLFEPHRVEELFAAITARDRARVLCMAKELCDYDAESVLGEIGRYLKDSLFEGREQFGAFALDRFLRVISDAKVLLSTGADGEFVVAIALLKMLEALEAEEIESLIVDYEHRVGGASTAASSVSAVVKAQVPLQKIVVTEVDKEAAKLAKRWSELIARIYERDYELGVVFERVVQFVDFRDDMLFWHSSAEGEDRKILREFYSVVRNVVQEVFGHETQIKLADKPKEEKTEQSAQNSEYIEENSVDNAQSETEHVQQPQRQDDILNHPAVKRAIELFDIPADAVQVVQKT